MVIKQDKFDKCINGFLKLISGKWLKAPSYPPPPKYVYEPPERYLLPSELEKRKKKKKKRKKDPIKTLALTKGGVEAYRKPYRCIRPCVHPETGTIRYQEYFCYPPLHCEPLKYHPPVGRPVDCTCEVCDVSCQKGCGCVPECVRVREVRAQVSHLQAPCDLEPVTVCIPVPPRKAPERVCNTCVLELRVDEEFNILNDKKVRKHIHKEDRKFQEEKKKFKLQEFNRLKRIGRLCPTLHMDPKDMPKKIAEGDGLFRITAEKGMIYLPKNKFRERFKKQREAEKAKKAKKTKSFKHKLKKCMHDSKTSLMKTINKGKAKCEKMKENLEKKTDKPKK